MYNLYISDIKMCTPCISHNNDWQKTSVASCSTNLYPFDNIELNQLIIPDTSQILLGVVLYDRSLKYHTDNSTSKLRKLCLEGFI
jgi:hypothetical protein